MRRTDRAAGWGPPRVAIRTLGCKVNQYDAAVLAKALADAGLAMCQAGQEADLVVVHSCTVTRSADRQNRQLIRRLRGENPHAVLLVTGCQAEVDPASLRAMPEVDGVVGVRDRDALPALATQVLLGRRLQRRPTEAVRMAPWGAGVDHLPGRTRAFLKVQDGCDALCTYCIVPRARGPGRSRPVQSVLDEIRLMERAGVQEVVLTGIHLGHYGRDLIPACNLTELLHRVLDSCGIPRIRLSSIEPLEVETPLLTLLGRSGRVCPHLHLPLQSGDDEILARMNRPYTAAQYRERVRQAMSQVPDLTLGCDVIVGFPGESEDRFLRTLAFVEEMPFAYLHVFPYSPRPGTPAADLAGRVAPPVVKSRAQRLRDLSLARRQGAMAAFVGRTLPVLVEGPAQGRRTWMQGLTHNYLRVMGPGGQGLCNRIVPFRMEGVEGPCLVGTPVPNPQGH